jgi:anti-sigma-K factor RsiG
MVDQKRRLVERIVDPSYLDGLGDKALADLRAMREECREGELELSFERRLCQARIDILSAELERRASGDESDLLARLPQILAKDAMGRSGGEALPSRAPDFSIPRNADVPRRRVEEIVGEQTLAKMPTLAPEEIKGIIASLGEHERKVSERRRNVHDVIDAIQGEIVRRYTADPGSALT